MDHYLQAGMIVLLISLWWSTARLDGSVRTIERNLSAILRHLNIDPTAVVPPSDRSSSSLLIRSAESKLCASIGRKQAQMSALRKRRSTG